MKSLTEIRLLASEIPKNISIEKLWKTVTNKNEKTLEITNEKEKKAKCEIKKIESKSHEKNCVSYIKKNITDLYGIINLYFPTSIMPIMNVSGKNKIVEDYNKAMLNFEMDLSVIDKEIQKQIYTGNLHNLENQIKDKTIIII